VAPPFSLLWFPVIRSNFQLKEIIMADKATFQKEIEAKLNEWNKIIDELRAEGEMMLKSGSGDLIDHAEKSQMILNKYLEARQ